MQHAMQHAMQQGSHVIDISRSPCAGLSLLLRRIYAHKAAWASSVSYAAYQQQVGGQHQDARRAWSVATLPVRPLCSHIEVHIGSVFCQGHVWKMLGALIDSLLLEQQCCR